MSQKHHTDFLNFLPLIHTRVLRPFERMFHENLSTLQVITLCLLRQGGPFSITELADRLCLSKQQMAKLIAQLNLKGYVARSQSSDDRRVVMVELHQRASDMLSARRESYFGELIGRIRECEGDELAERFMSAADEMCNILAALPACARPTTH